MLSISTLSSASQAKNYYQQTDYYIDGTKQNEWFGKGADKLGLSGEVNFTAFEQVLLGNLPDGTKMATGYSKGEAKHRPGYDLTFSAPKSLSILALVADDKRLVHAHQEAVKETLAHVEKTLMATRVKKKGEIEVHQTDNMVASLFLHTDSRALDPNLHTHCVIANVTAFDKWRAIYGDDFYKNKMELGFHYRNILAEKLHQLGYDFYVKSKEGLIEIEGVSQEMLDLFSTRRQQILDKLETMNGDSGKAAAIANLLTRANKQSITMDEAKLAWDSMMQQAGLSKEDLTERVKDSEVRGPVEPSTPDSIATQAIDNAIQDHVATASVFTVREVMKTAGRYTVGHNVSDNYLTKSLEAAIDSNQVMYAGEGWLTTRAARLKELQLIKDVKEHQLHNWHILGLGSEVLSKRAFADEKQRLIAKDLVNGTVAKIVYMLTCGHNL